MLVPDTRIQLYLGYHRQLLIAYHFDLCIYAETLRGKFEFRNKDSNMLDTVSFFNF